MATKGRLADYGWCWEGHSTTQPRLSMFGVGQGARWFGLRRACYMFLPNVPLGMELLADMDEVVCDISKWESGKPANDQASPMGMVHDGTIARKRLEAERVARLSLDFPNVTGVFDDDLYGKISAERITPAEYATVGAAAHAVNPRLKRWGVVYTHELQPDNWRGFTDLLDIVNLWVWASKDVYDLDRHLAQCRAIFGDKPIVMGCYLRDYTISDAVPMDHLRFQWEKVAEALDDGRLAGYSILKGSLIDLHEPEARWVKEFIAAH